MPDFADLIPLAQRDAARAALASAFGQATPVTLQPVAGGASGALTYRVDAMNRSYLMRVEGPRRPLRNPHQYTCMQIAADAGIAPPLRFTDAEAGVAIMDFLPLRPLAEYPGGAAGLAEGAGRLIARLQATSAFPILTGYQDILGRMFGFVRASGLFAPGLLDRHAEGLARIREAYPRAGPGVSSHNDPNPMNVVFDGRRLWLIDWETAYRNDPFTDIAIAADQYAPEPDLLDVLLAAWLGHAPDRVVHARLTVMRQLTRLYYASLILAGFAGVPRAVPDADLSAPTPLEFREAAAQGRVQVGTRETLYLMAKMYLAMFSAGLNAPEFEEALRIVRGG